MNDNEIDDELENTVLRLSDYLAAVDLVIKETFRHSVWVKAEIRNISSKNGHYYLELAEKDDGGKVIASCRGNLWKFKAGRVLKKFEAATGMQLERDVTVLMNVSANFHSLYGFSLNINDIDPSYTLGDIARQYAAIIEKLGSEGLLNLNKQISAPFDIEHVLVIAPEKAAGLGDFKADANRLEHTGACHFHYNHATFQGNHAPKELRHAITKGMLSFNKKYKRAPDVMVIIRGGGAVGDLAYLNDYELAALVAEQPIPVWVGIGHERDNVILDEVAHTSFDTPSKVIAGITNHLMTLMQTAQQYADNIKLASQEQINTMNNNNDRKFLSIQNASIQSIMRWQHQSDSYFNSIKQHAKYEIREAKSKSKTFLNSIQQNSALNVIRIDEDINRLLDASKHASQKLIQDTNKQLKHYQQIIVLQNPTRLLSQGYALIKDETGTYISSAHKLSKGDFIHVTMQDAELTSVVTDISHAVDKIDID